MRILTLTTCAFLGLSILISTTPALAAEKKGRVKEQIQERSQNILKAAELLIKKTEAQKQQEEPVSDVNTLPTSEAPKTEAATATASQPQTTTPPTTKPLPLPTTTNSKGVVATATPAATVSFNQNNGSDGGVYALSDALSREQTRNMLGASFALALLGALLMFGRRFYSVPSLGHITDSFVPKQTRSRA